MEASNRRGCLLPEPVQRAALLRNIALGENRDGSYLVEDDALSVTRRTDCVGECSIGEFSEERESTQLRR